MRMKWTGIVTVILLAVVSGCASTQRQQIKKPQREEIYGVPPAADARFNGPPRYPDNLLNQDRIKLAVDQTGPPPSMRQGMGGSPGMGGPRMGGGPGGY
jgi:hypothetical protein